MHKAMTSSQGISATEGPAPKPEEGLLLFHLPYVLRSRFSTWDWRTGCVWRELGIWEVYWMTMEHTGSQGAGKKAPCESQGLANVQGEIYMKWSPLHMNLGEGNCVDEKSVLKSKYNKPCLFRNEHLSPHVPTRDPVSRDKTHN